MVSRDSFYFLIFFIGAIFPDDYFPFLKFVSTGLERRGKDDLCFSMAFLHGLEDLAPRATHDICAEKYC